MRRATLRTEPEAKGLPGSFPSIPKGYAETEKMQGRGRPRIAYCFFFFG